MRRREAEGTYLRLVRTDLPARAAAEGWVIRLDHCFMRVVLDHVVGRCWYEVLDRSGPPAYRQLTDDQLAEGVALARGLLAGSAGDVAEADARSLAWRGKQPKRR